MRRILGIGLAALMLLAGCGQEEVAEPIFSITTEERTAYIAEMDDICYDYYWSYDKDSLVFLQGVVPEDTESNPEYFAATSAVGLEMEGFAGKDAVLGVASLLHYNGDVAGEFSCWFVGEEMVGAYYLGGYDNSPYSLLERNPFLADGGFVAYENWVEMDENFRQYNGTLPIDGFVSAGYDNSGNPVVANISGSTLGIYGLSGNYLSRVRSKKFETNQTLLGATFLDFEGEAAVAVLLTETEEQILEADDTRETEEVITIKKEKVLLYSYDWEELGEVPLQGYGYTTVAMDGEVLLAFTADAMERYNYIEETWTKIGKSYLKHNVTQAHIVDLDDNGVAEYFLTDGLDLYVYQQQETGFVKIWSTHLGVENLYGSLYSGDLNRDGVSEVYLCDSTGTTIRYVLTERGFRSSNEDIAYGEALYVFDINGDGLDDYWRVESGTMNTGNLYLANE